MLLDNIRAEVRSLPGYSAPERGRPVVKLDQNECPFDLPEEIKRRALERLRTTPWNRYPGFENPELREKLAARLGVSPNQVLLGHGSNQIIYSLAMAVLERGTRLVYSPPTFSLFELVGRIFGAELHPVPQLPGFVLDGEAIAQAAEGARITMIASPNNPTGAALDPAYLDRIAGNTSGLVLWDEAYHEFYGRTGLPAVQRHRNVLVLRTFSKAFGLAGVRFGFLVGDPEVIAELRKVNLPFNVDRLSEAVVDVALDNDGFVRERVERIVRERQRLYTELAATPGVVVFPSETNFLLIRVPKAEIVFRSLLSQGVFVRSFVSVPGLEGCLRVTVGAPEENDLLLAALQKALAEAGVSVEQVPAEG
ncbi:MAG: histidinol-phosphate transaminase [candidate division KSB1 bacterium]|nr:histidinol-phosphate transaminase [candidate division KSB1 bacterium]